MCKFILLILIPFYICVDNVIFLFIHANYFSTCLVYVILLINTEIYLLHDLSVVDVLQLEW